MTLQIIIIFCIAEVLTTTVETTTPGVTTTVAETTTLATTTPVDTTTGELVCFPTVYPVNPLDFLFMYPV